MTEMGFFSMTVSILKRKQTVIRKVLKRIRKTMKALITMKKCKNECKITS